MYGVLILFSSATRINFITVMDSGNLEDTPNLILTPNGSCMVSFVGTRKIVEVMNCIDIRDTVLAMRSALAQITSTSRMRKPKKPWAPLGVRQAASFAVASSVGVGTKLASLKYGRSFAQTCSISRFGSVETLKPPPAKMQLTTGRSYTLL